MLYNKIRNRYLHEKRKMYRRIEDTQAKKIILGKQNPIYHVHIRKTGGTSINYSFLEQIDKDAKTIYDELIKKENHRLIKDDKVLVGWNKQFINQGYFTYAFSHIPLHELSLNPDTFIFTCMRDPARRVISLYNMLRFYEINEINHPCMKTQGKWLGDSFDYFLNTIPKEHFLNQIFMFSKNIEINEAFDKLCSLNHIVFTETLSQDMTDLGQKLNLDLSISNQKSYGHKENISESQKSKLIELLEPEYKLIEMLKREK